MIAEGSNAVRYYATDHVGEPPRAATLARLRQHRQDRRRSRRATGLAPVSTQTDDAKWSKEVTRTVTLAGDRPVADGRHRRLGRALRRAEGQQRLCGHQQHGLCHLHAGQGHRWRGRRRQCGDLLGRWTGPATSRPLAPGTSTSTRMRRPRRPRRRWPASATTGWRNTPATVTFGWTDASSGVPTGGTTLSGERRKPDGLCQPVHREHAGLDEAHLSLVRPGSERRGHADRLRQHRRDRPRP